MSKETDYSVEDDKETEEVISNAALSEFERLKARLKKEAEEANKHENLPN